MHSLAKHIESGIGRDGQYAVVFQKDNTVLRRLQGNFFMRGVLRKRLHLFDSLQRKRCGQHLVAVLIDKARYGHGCALPIVGQTADDVYSKPPDIHPCDRKFAHRTENRFSVHEHRTLCIRHGLGKRKHDIAPDKFLLEHGERSVNVVDINKNRLGGIA